MSVTVGSLVLVTASAAGGVAGLVLAGYIWEYRGKAGASWFVAALLIQTLWCLSYAVSLLVFDSVLRRLLEATSFTAMAALGVVFLGFALTYTGRSNLVDRWWYGALLAVPVLTGVLTVTNEMHRLVWSEFRMDRLYGAATVRYTLEPWAVLTLVVAILTVGVAVVLLVDTVLSYGPLYRREAAAVAFSTIPPAAALLVWAFGLGPVPQLNLAPALFVLHAAFDAYAFVDRDMFETNPTTLRAAERDALDDLQNPVIILDRERTVVRFNDAASQVFGLTQATIGRDVATVLSVDLETLREQDSVAFPVVANRRFAASVSTLTDPRNTPVGSTIVLQDITGERRRQERLTVLNRVLRHNLRNDMTVVDGFAEQIAETTTDERIESWAEAIGDAGGDLLSIGESVRAFERAGGDDPTPEVLDVQEFIATVVSAAQQSYPDAIIEEELAVPEGSTIETDPGVLRVVLEHLIENAIEHDPSETPHVRVSAQRRGEPLVVAVSDSGPGIPETELGPIRSGTESDLDHGSGIGLWIVRWGVDALGGELSFDVTTSGTTVEVALRGIDRQA